jgi:Asp/Glu/Hydantoin racemase
MPQSLWPSNVTYETDVPQGGVMRLLMVNPNVTQAITDIMAAEARRSASPGTEITAVTARFGTLYVENRGEAAVAGHALLDTLAEHGSEGDAVIVATFGDPGVPGAIAGKFTVSQKCLSIKELAPDKIGTDAAPAEEICGRSPIIMSRSILRTHYFC